MIHYEAVMMGSPIRLSLSTDKPDRARSVFQLIRQQEQLLTVNRNDSLLMAVNRSAGQCPVVVPNDVFQLVSLAKQVSLLPGSLFNVAIGPLVKAWRIGFTGCSPPPTSVLRCAMQHIDPQDVVLDPDRQSVFLRKKGMEIDLGAIAKGYIADKICQYLSEQQEPYALINLGGNIHTLGQPEHGPWQIGLRKPFAAATTLSARLAVCGRSVVTSGIYERFFLHQQQCYHHILDSRSGYPLNNDLLSVTVVSESSLMGDIYSTLLYGMGLAGSLAWLAHHPELEAIMITRDNAVICSSQRNFHCQVLNELV
ncbi:FAD:protein FMN transferase [Rosenbergiella australiborealis]|uniref:FAD:protein FMN transferase n=1 Tax=Rosenbergiella australiborealis TaxID=1544696 RepID=A0ABS5T0W4_9GAMM|nr:FAD:protein FMN transferase [Rosenbergiella australiborealis]MBT0725976.1 FAD:protein FMN transferase [Rosenbergiella australiborealis]